MGFARFTFMILTTMLLKLLNGAFGKKNDSPLGYMLPILLYASSAKALKFFREKNI